MGLLNLVRDGLMAGVGVDLLVAGSMARGDLDLLDDGSMAG
ncbi:hypothetical protein [Nonomuraea sp. NPDC050691]